jgi:hypothetical protein
MNVNLLTATQAVEKTMPFVLYRWLVNLAIAFGFLLAALGGAGTAIAFSSFASDPTVFANVGAVVGFVAFGCLVYVFRRTLADEVAHPHLLLTGRVVKGESIPAGVAQIAFAKQSLRARFPNNAERRDLGNKLHDTLSRLPSLFGIRIELSQYPKLTDALSRGLARLSAANADVGLAVAATERELGIWESARGTILRHAQHLRSILRQRGYVAVFEALGCVVSFAALLVPLLKIAAALPFPTGFWPYVFAGVFSWNIKASFLEPISQAAMMKLDLSLDKPEPDSGLTERMADASADFKPQSERSASPP